MLSRPLQALIHHHFTRFNFALKFRETTISWNRGIKVPVKALVRDPSSSEAAIVLCKFVLFLREFRFEGRWWWRSRILFILRRWLRMFETWKDKSTPAKCYYVPQFLIVLCLELIYGVLLIASSALVTSQFIMLINFTTVTTFSTSFNFFKIFSGGLSISI